MTPEPIVERAGVRLYNGEALGLLRAVPSDSIDAVITDPPYSSGGATRSDRNQPVAAKYVHGGVKVERCGFSGDNRDVRSWLYWCALWISECLRITKPSGYFLMFSDWRQIALAMDAIQIGGFVLRGIVPWDKTEGSRGPHTGYFRHQCEYVVWGTRGPSAPASWGGPWPGYIRCAVRQSDKHHITGKPTPVMKQLVQCCPPGGVVLDPFAGSGTTLVAASSEGRRAIGFEQSAEYCGVVDDRLQQVPLLSPSDLPPVLEQLSIGGD